MCEGETSYLAACARFGDDELAPAVLGIVSGSWTAEIASRIPDGAEVVIATDADDAGERYAAQIVATFGERSGVSLSRWRARP